MTIYKILPKRQWLAAMQAGCFNGSPIDIADGFIHCLDGGSSAPDREKAFCRRRGSTAGGGAQRMRSGLRSNGNRHVVGICSRIFMDRCQ